MEEHRPTKHYLKNPEARIRETTARAFRVTTDAGAVSALCELQGVQVRTASALLHWMVPDRFPILDVRVVAPLGEPEPGSWEDLQYYARIAERCRQLAHALRLDLRTLDRALWTWDKRRRFPRG